MEIGNKHARHRHPYLHILPLVSARDLCTRPDLPERHPRRHEQRVARIALYDASFLSFRRRRYTCSIGSHATLSNSNRHTAIVNIRR